MSIVDLGIVHRVDVARRTAIRGRAPADVRRLPGARGHPRRRRRRARRLRPPGRGRALTFAVPWTSDRITPAGRAALARGRDRAADRRASAERLAARYCGSARRRLDSAFGPTQCRSSTTAAAAASRSRRSSRSDVVLGAVRRRRRRRDDGRRHRPGRARGRPRGRAPRRRRGGDRARPRPDRDGPRPAAPAKLDLDADAIDDWVDGGSARLRDAPILDAARAPRPTSSIEAALEDLEAEADDLPGARRGAPTRRRSSRRTRARCRSPRSPRRRTARSGSSACTSSIRRRSCRSSRSSPAATDPAVVDRAIALVEAWGKTPVRCADTPGLHRQPGQPAVHDRGAARCSRPARPTSRRSTRRCATPASRWARSS